MTSNVSSKGPAFLLRMRRARSASVVMRLYVQFFESFAFDTVPSRAEHFVRIVGLDDVIDVETVHRAAIEMSGVVRTRERSDEAAPLGNRQMERLMPNDPRDGACDLLSGCGHF